MPNQEVLNMKWNMMTLSESQPWIFFHNQASNLQFYLKPQIQVSPQRTLVNAPILNAPLKYYFSLT